MISCFVPVCEDRQNVGLVGRGYISPEENMYTLKKQATSPVCYITATDTVEGIMCI